MFQTYGDVHDFPLVTNLNTLNHLQTITCRFKIASFEFYRILQNCTTFNHSYVCLGTSYKENLEF